MSNPADIELRLKAVVENLGALTGMVSGLDGVEKQAGETQTAATALDRSIESLLDVQGQIQEFNRLQASLGGTSAALATARDRQRELSTQVAASLGPTTQQLAEQKKSAEAITQLEVAIEKTRVKQAALTQQVIAAQQPSARLLQRHEESTRKLDGLQRGLDVARQRQLAANTAVAAGSEPTEKLARQHEAATRAVEKLSGQASREKAEMDGLAAALGRAGVESGRFGETSQRISQTLSRVTEESRRFAEAQSKFSFVPHEQIEREARALQQSYNLLRESGKLSGKELAQVNLRLQEGLLELERRTNGWKDSLINARVEIGQAIVAFAPIAKSTQIAVEFETALAGVRKVVEGSDEQFDALAGRIRELSKELPISSKGLADIAAAGGQLGVPIEKLDQFVVLAAKVGTAFNISSDQAGQAVAKLSNVFGIPIDNVEALADAINTLGNNTAATEGGIIDFLTRVGGSARTFGLSAEAVAALGATMISFGKAPEVAANGVSALLTRLQTANVQSPKVQEALQGIGLSATDLADRIRKDPQEALNAFLQTLSKLDAQARAEAIAEIVGLEYADDISLLVNNLGQYSDALDVVNDRQKVGGALQREFDTQAKTTANQLVLLKNQISDTALELGQAFLPALRAAVAVGTDVAEAIGAIVQAAPGLTAAAATAVAFGASLGALRIAAASVRVGVAGMLGSLSAVVPGLAQTSAASDSASGKLTGLAGVMSSLPRLLGIGVALAGAELVISALLEIRKAQQAIEAAEAKARSDASARVAQANEQKAAFSAYSAVLVRTADEIAALSQTESARYRQQLDGALQYEQANLKAALSLQSLGIISEQEMAEVVTRFRAVKAASESLNAQLAQQPASPFAALADTIGQLKSELASVEDIAKLPADALAAFGQRGEESLRLAQEQLVALKAEFPGLANVSNEALALVDARFEAAVGNIEAVGKALQTVRDEQFKRLGIDAQAVLTGIDSKTRELIETFDSLAGDASTDFRLVQASAKALLNQLDTPQEIEAFIASLKRAAAAGQDVSKPLEEAKKKLGEMQDAANAAAKELEDAFKLLGITSTAALNEATSKAETAFDLVRKKTGLFSRESAEGFSAYAEASLKSAAAQGDVAFAAEAAGLRITAAGLGQLDQLDKIVGGYAKKGDAAEAAANRATKANAAEVKSVNEIEEATRRARIEAAGAEADKRRAQNLSAVAGGNLVDGRKGFGLLSAEDQQLVLEQAQRDNREYQRQASQARQGTSTSGPADAIAANFQRARDEDLNRLIEQLNSGTGAASARNALRSSLGLGSTAPDRNTAEANQQARLTPPVRVVRIELPAVGGFSGGAVSAVDGDSAATLEAFIRSLTSARRGST